MKKACATSPFALRYGHQQITPADESALSSARELMTRTTSAMDSCRRRSPHTCGTRMYKFSSSPSEISLFTRTLSHSHGASLLAESPLQDQLNTTARHQLNTMDQDWNTGTSTPLPFTHGAGARVQSFTLCCWRSVGGGMGKGSLLGSCHGAGGALRATVKNDSCGVSLARGTGFRSFVSWA